jgi:glucosamine--fructose-6-phosphate aminotransferase (isomerizing)
MEAEIREQPSILALGAQRYFRAATEALPPGPFDMILLAARGSSDHAALYSRYLFEITLGIPVSLAAPSVLTRYGARVRYPRCLCIGISQSGAAPDVAEVLSALRADGHATLAITNTPYSRITQSAAATLLLDSGPEQSVAATKTFTSTLLALYEVARALGADLGLPGSSLPNDAWLEEAHQAADRAVGAIVRATTVFCLGRGYRFSSAVESALKLMECSLIPAKSYSTADFQHGPKALAGFGTAALVYGDAPTTLQEQGCEVLNAPNPPEHVPETLVPIWDAIFGQYVALLAARARRLDPDSPAHLSKVTETL